MMSAALLAFSAGALDVSGPRDRDSIAHDDVPAHSDGHEDHRATLQRLEDRLTREPDDPVALYNTACALAQLGRLEEADAQLMRAIKSGFHRFSHMKRDPDLDLLRARRTYRAIMQARDVSDDLFAQRRINAWRGRLREAGAAGEYTLVRDEGRKLDLLSPLEPDEGEALLAKLARGYDYLVEHVFGEGLSHRVLSVIPDDSIASSFFGDSHVHGRYRHEAREIVLGGASAAPMHELTHALHHAHMDRLNRAQPLWVQEGLASLFESAAFDEAGAIEIFANERDRILTIERALGWRQFFAMDDDAFLANPAVHYAQARAVFAFLHERGVLPVWYASYIEGVESGEEDGDAHVRAFEHVFDMPLAEIEATWRDWLSSRTLRFNVDDRGVATFARAASRDDDSDIHARQENAGVDVGGRAAPDASAREPDPIDEVLSADAADRMYARVRPRSLDAYAGSIVDLHRVLWLDPAHSSARYDLALGLIAAGRYRDAAAQRDVLRTLDRNLARLVDSLLHARR